MLILTLLGLAQSTTYYIKPNQTDRCPRNKQPCQTLSEFAAKNSNGNNKTLIVLPGDHGLDTNLSFSGLSNLVITSENDDVTVRCDLTSRFSFESIEEVSLKDMNFIGCGRNLVRDVGRFILQGVTFKGLDGSGTALAIIDSMAGIIDSTFVGNQFGTIMESVESLKLITTNIVWLIVRNNVTGIVRVGGSIITNRSNVSISDSRFENNTAEIGGDIFADRDNTVSIYNTTFIGNGRQPVNKESPFGGAIFSHQNTLSVMMCQFRNKHATVGASLVSSVSKVMINASNFDSNSASDHSAGVLGYNSTISIYGSTFHNNTAIGGAGVTTHQGSVTLVGSNFTNNTAHQHGAALDFGSDTSFISGCHFEGNVAHSFAGAVLVWFSNCTMYGRAVLPGEEALQVCDERCSDDSQENGDASSFSEFSLGDKTRFINNSAPAGAALYGIRSTIKSCGPFYFSNNFAILNSNVYLLNSDGVFRGLFELNHNLGSFFAFSSNITFSGCTRFFNNTPPVNTTINFKGGGALTLYQTMLSLSGEITFEYNHADIGGAIVATESEIYLSNQVNVVNNSASISGGGLYLAQSELFSLQDSNLTVLRNMATERGGGIHAVSSSIKNVVTGLQYTDLNRKVTEEFRGATLNIMDNSAQKGGGLCLEANSKVIMLKDFIFRTTMRSTLNFVRNSAQYGGAIYIDDESNSGSRVSNPFEIKSPKSECFMNVVSTQTIVTTRTNFSLSNVLFDGNSATVSGPTLFGGLLDRCIVSPFNEVDRTIDQTTNELLTYKGDGLQYLMDISSVSTKQSISSHPVQVCLCINRRQNCTYQLQGYAEVIKGYYFNMSLVAVDQVYEPINATIEGHLSSTGSSLLTGQVTQIPNACTNVTFQIISSRLTEELILFADGPCKDAELSKMKVSVNFLPCSCPIGFVPSNAFNGMLCLCACDSQISPYVTECNSTTQTFRRAVNVWISYINRSNTSGFVAYNCPFDYCVPPNASQPINLNQPNAVDTQCALNRTGTLCGACKPGLSLSLGSSKCLKCPSYWPALFMAITIFVIIAGIGLVVLFLWLNITVAIGTLNGLLFYANIVAANRVVLLPYPEPNFITVFISWLNLELGIDVCFIDGMDIYIKTWIQLAFPIYIIFLVVLLIIISHYSSRFSNLISKRNPVATLATLILISYGNLFHVVLLAQPFSFASLTYPDGYREILWLPDATVGYLAEKHIILFIVALLILVFCIAYSFLLLCWQLILYLQSWKVFKCIKSPTLYVFMEAYHVPYTPKHRYWTGLLLLARAIVYLIATANVSGDPQIQLISIIFILICIFLLKMFIATKIFKRWLIDSLESFFYFNIVFFASFTAYNLSTGGNQDGIAYISVVLSIVVTIFILFYHFYAYTSLFSCACKSKLVTNFKKRFISKLKSKFNEDSPFSIADLSVDISRYDDIMDLNDISVSDAEYHSADSYLNNRPGPTRSVVEIN